jgi:hypothetical protein
MAANLRSALSAIPQEPISGDAVLLALGFLGRLSELSIVATILGEDTSPTAISRLASAVYDLEKKDLVRRDIASPRKIELTERGRRTELQIREQLIRKAPRVRNLAAAA